MTFGVKDMKKSLKYGKTVFRRKTTPLTPMAIHVTMTMEMTMTINLFHKTYKSNGIE